MDMSQHQIDEFEIQKIDYLKARQAAQRPLERVKFPPLSADETKQLDEDVKAGRLPF